MIIEVNRLTSKPSLQEEDVSFPSDKFKCLPPLLEIVSCHVKAESSSFDDFIEVNVILDAEVKLTSSYSLKPFIYRLHTHEEYHFATSIEEGDNDITLYKGSEIRMDDYLFALISASLPISPKAPGEALPKSGDGYRVISEKDFEKEQSEECDPRFDKLKDLDID